MAKEIYENWAMYSPSGQLLSYCDSKRVGFYLKNNLAEQIDKKSIRLNFEPHIRTNLENPYYLTPIKNICVACGTKEDLSRHHCVPWCFRTYFPNSLKTHDSHDILALCIKCHKIYERQASGLKKSLCSEYEVQMHMHTYSEGDRRLQSAKSYSNAILRYSEKIPQDKLREMKSFMAEYLGINEEDLADDMLRSVLKLKYTCDDRKWAKELVAKIDDIPEFCKRWREHFVKMMKPKFLPKHWKVDLEPVRG